jgi:hypothetical protein
MLMGEGLPSQVDVYTFTSMGPQRSGSRTGNPNGIRAWKEDASCIWLAHGLYSKTTGQALKPDYFFRFPGTARSVDWIADFWKPFMRQFTHQVRLIHPTAIIFAEPPVNEMPPLWIPEQGDPTSMICYAPHWYDGITLMNKVTTVLVNPFPNQPLQHFSPWWTIDYLGYKRGQYWSIVSALSFGLSGIHRTFAKQLGLMRQEGLDRIGMTVS